MMVKGFNRKEEDIPGFSKDWQFQPLKVVDPILVGGLVGRISVGLLTSPNLLNSG